MNVRAPAKGQTGSQPRTAQPQVQIDTSLDDDQLEIPAFLRRQAN
jgi:cell division protein FtsZ